MLKKVKQLLGRQNQVSPRCTGELAVSMHECITYDRIIAIYYRAW